jgi:hypothetical protein
MPGIANKVRKRPPSLVCGLDLGQGSAAVGRYYSFFAGK